VQVSSTGSNNPAELLHEIETNFRAGNKARALQLAKEGVEQDSGGSLSKQIGLRLLENRCYPEAAAAFEKALSRAPGSVDLASKLAYAYVGADQADRAITLLSYLEGRQSSWQANFLLGQAYELADKPQEALRSFREAVRLKPDEANVHYELGRLLINSPDMKVQAEGAEEMGKAIRLNPQGTDYYINLSGWLINHDVKSAVVLLTQLVRNSRPSDKLYLMLGLAQYGLYGSGPAIPTLKKVIDLNPHAAPAYNLLGGCYFRDGDYNHALKYYQRATEEDPQNGLYYYGVARALESLNRVSEAIPVAERSISLEPRSGRSHYLLGKIYAKLGRDNEAVQELETAVRLDPDSESSYYLLARTYMRLNDPDKAQQWTQKLRELTIKERQKESKKGQAERRVLEGMEGPLSEPSDLSQPSEVREDLGGSQPSARPGPP
jgi:tetratricopeptide (TPR) repeat protein